MTEWFAGLDALEKIYWVIAFIGSIFFVIILITTFVGGDTDTMGDADFDGGIDFQFLSFKNIVGFVTIFGWSGLAGIYSGWSYGVAISVSVLCGAAMMLAMAGLFYLLRNSGESGTLKMKNAINKVGEVYIPIGANRSSIGKVQITVQGALRELEALTDESIELQHGNVVKVVKLVTDEILLVELVKS